MRFHFSSLACAALLGLCGSNASAAAPGYCFDDPDRCAAYYLSISTSPDAQARFEAHRELAVLSYDKGEIKAALKHFDAALFIRPNDPFCTLERAWAYLSEGKPRLAEGEFRRATGLSTNPGAVTEAKLGMALSEMYKGDRDSAATHLRLLYTKEPLLISFTAERLGMLMERAGRPQYAQIYYQQALQHDPYNQLAADAMARLSEKDGSWVQAWQYYATLANLDPLDAKPAEKINKLSPKLKGDPVNYFYYSRLSAPFQTHARFTPSPEVRVGLFAAKNGQPVGLYSFSLQAASSFTVVSQAGTPLAFGKPQAAWSFSVNRDDGMLEIRNQWGTVELATAGTLRIVPAEKGASFLIKGARTPSLFETDLSDRELRGFLSVHPSSAGIALVNTVPLEDFLPGAVGSSKIPGQEKLAPEPAEMRALAVVLRTRALELAAKASPSATYDFADSANGGVQYYGVNMEADPSVSAVDHTRGVTLKNARPDLHLACGGATELASDDTEYRPAGPEPSSQRDLLSIAPGNLLCSPEDPTRWAISNWTVNIDGDDIRRRMKRDYPQAGRLRALRPVRRAPDGSLLALELVGSDQTVLLEGLNKIAALLAPGAVRSTKFKLIPIYRGAELDEVIVRGKGTGHLRGLCLLGAHGLSDQGKSYRDILAHYFPGSVLVLNNYADGTQAPLAPEQAAQPAPTKQQKAAAGK